MARTKLPRETWLVGTLVLVALAARIYQVGWGLPFVYEEATPLKTAWKMGEWGTPRGIDLNPHFFKYPSLTIYFHFAAQGVLYLAMKFRGLVSSGVEYHARYIVDPTPFYYVGRLISVLFGTATVWLTYRVGRHLAARWTAFVAAAAAALLAINTYHVSRCHLVEVDVPLTFLVMLSLWLVLRAFERPTPKYYVLAGAAIGLAASVKYTGAMLLVPLAVAHVFALRDGAARNKWTYGFLSLGVAAAAFLLTSPYVLLDAGTFIEHFSSEREHMRLGHFGLTGSSSWFYYARSLGETILGWPAAILGVFGLVYTAGVRRRKPALVLAAFVAPYLVVVSTWSMHADRYLLPVLPVLLLFATTVVGEAIGTAPALRWPKSARVGTVAVLITIMAVPTIMAYPTYLRSIRTDTRTTAADWIEANISPGSYLVVEPYGPEVLGPLELSQVNSAIRNAAIALQKGKPNYAILWMPIFQMGPERSGVFYDHALYENADYFVSTSAVRSRYEGEPDRFRRQLAFYDSLEVAYENVAEFTPDGDGGPSITIYKSPQHAKPFGARASVAPPRLLRHGRASPTGSEEFFYYNLGINYEVFLRLQEAADSYKLAFHYPVTRPASYMNLAFRRSRCLASMGRHDEAVEFLDAVITKAPTPAVRDVLQRVRDVMAGERGPSDS